jgi:hypothetical protein
MVVSGWGDIVRLEACYRLQATSSSLALGIASLSSGSSLTLVLRPISSSSESDELTKSLSGCFGVRGRWH